MLDRTRLDWFLSDTAASTTSSAKLLRLLLRLPPLSSRLSLLHALRLGQFPRPSYAYCMIRAAELALKLGHRAVSVIEFGVAGGNGLVAMEQAAARIERRLPVSFRIYGFDLGEGLPQPADYRDLPYHWQAGFFRMDVESLRRRLARAELLLGDVADTVGGFAKRGELDDAPIGMIAFDLDLWSATSAAFRVFRTRSSAILPRIMCYMDDVTGTMEYYSDYTGVRLAISEYNYSNQERKLSPCYDFEHMPLERWQQKVYVHHDFDHPSYSRYVGDRAAQSQLPLEA